jgi:hypothetical protein
MVEFLTRSIRSKLDLAFLNEIQNDFDLIFLLKKIKKITMF